MLIDAFVLAALGCIDALLTSMVADSLTRTQHNSDKELIGQGLGNLASGLFGGLAGAGATMGTVVNIQTGGRTALSGLVRAILLMVVVLGAANLIAPIPLAVLAGIAVKVGFDILDWSFLKRAHSVSWKGTMIMYGVLFLTVFVDLIVAVGVGVFIANILKCRPPQNRDPTAEELSMLGPFVRRHIDLAEPEVLILMGNFACQGLIGRRGITRLRGQWQNVAGRPAIPMFHPAFLLRRPAEKAKAWADLLELQAKLRSL